MTAPRVRLVDSPDGPPRTTAALLASLRARLGTLFVVSGADAVGSLASGVAAVGREVAETAEGHRARAAIEAGLAGGNGAMLWRALDIDAWISPLPAAPVLDQLRNDYGLLLSPDLDAALDSTPAAPEQAGGAGGVPDQPATFADFAVGLWYIAGQVREMIDALIGTAAEAEIVDGPEHTRGRILR